MLNDRFLVTQKVILYRKGSKFFEKSKIQKTQLKHLLTEIISIIPGD